MIRSLAFASAALPAASCQAAILSQLTLTSHSNTEPTSVSSGTFGTSAVNGVTDFHAESPFVANTEYYVPFQDVHFDERHDRTPPKIMILTAPCLG